MDAGNGTAGEHATLCLRISSNTSSGSNGAAGIGIRKQVTSTYGITGLSPSPATGAQAVAHIVADNPAGGGVDNISTSGGNGVNYTSCSTAPA